MSLSSRYFVRSTIAFLVVGFLTLLGIVGMTIWLGERAQVYFNEVIEARDTRSAAVDLRDALQSAESSQRGFIVTGNEIYLSPYGTAKAAAQRRQGVLQRTLASHPEMDVVVQRLTDIIAEKFREMDKTVALKRARRDDEALAVIRTNRGKTLTDEANVFFSGIIRAADERLTEGVNEQRANATRLRWVSIIGGIIIVLVIGGATVTVILYTRELAAARDEVGVLNTGLEKRVEERTAELAQANDEIKHFANVVSHDLRSPLVNIMGFTGELEYSLASLQALVDKSKQSDPKDPVVEQARIAAEVDLPEALGFIRTSTTRMNDLIAAILKLSRDGKRPSIPEQIVLADMIKASAATIQHRLSEAQGEISLDLDVPAIISDKLSLEQIIGNLLDNAVKYRSKSRPLRIGVKARQVSGDRIQVDIADNGRGIAEHDLKRVFELFRRSGEIDQPGDGIGLAHVRSLVRNLGGDITLTSALDKGTTFRVTLPRHLQAPQGSAS
jgi:signal transduction histidine kinase